MNQREKTLACLVAALLVIFGVYFIWSRTSAAFARRQATLANLTKTLQEQQDVLAEAAAAAAKLEALRQRSLPIDAERANSLYQQWLLNQVDRLGFIDPSVQVADRRVRGGFYNQSRFEIAGEATLDQLAHFLIAFYSSQDLHRISQLTARPIPDSRRLDLSVGIEAISIPGSSRTTVGELVSDDYRATQTEAVQQALVNRGMFFPLNGRPRIEAIPDQRVTKGQTIRVQATASDPDPWDLLAFSIDADSPPGLMIEQATEGEATLRWTPEETGEYNVIVTVSDSGSPPGLDVTSFRIAVVDPPPREEASGRRLIGFDDASQTYLVGTVGNGTSLQAWFSVRTRGDILKLSMGDSLDIGSVVGQVSRIAEDYVELSTEEGPLRIRIGRSLTEGVPAAPPTQQADSRP